MSAWNLAAQRPSSDGSTADELQAALRHAATYYELGIEGHGDLRAFEAGLANLQQAKELVEHGNLSPDEAAAMGQRIQASEVDLTEQIVQARGTLAGVFPLTRFLTASLFADSGPTATYRLIEDPALKATRDAATDLATQVGELTRRCRRRRAMPMCGRPIPWSTRRDKCSAIRRDSRCLPRRA
jgi:hypothetical protein